MAVAETTRLTMTPADLRRAREKLALTQREIALVLECDKTSVVRWESETARNRRSPPPRAVQLIHAYLMGFRPPTWPKDSRGA